MMLAIPSVCYGATPGSSVDSDKPPAAKATELNEAQMLGTAILAAVRANNERLQGLELSVVKDFRDKSVTEATKVHEPLPNGGAIVTTRLPSAHIQERAVVLEDRVRFETGGTGEFPSVTYWFDGIRWTRVDGNGGRVTKMRTDQLGGRIYDPREVVGVDPRTSLAKLLAPSALEHATVETMGTISIIHTQAAGAPLDMSFDSAVGLLPTSSKWFHRKGGLVREAVMNYDFVSERGGWVIREMVTHYFDLSADASQTPADWKQETRTVVTCRPLDLAAAEKELFAQIPGGNPAFDFTDGAASRRKPSAAISRPMTRSESTLKWFLGTHVVLIAAGAAVYVWRRTRRAGLLERY
jgi:hypothetical protein